MNKAIYAGTFDPLTYGHLDVVERACKCFDEVIIAVVRKTPNKDTLFSVEKRLELVQHACADFPNLEITDFGGLLVEYARSKGVRMIVRGLRAFSDFEYEFQMALTNRKLAPDIETLFLMPREKFSYISSSLIREIARLGGDTSGFVPAVVQNALNALK